MQEFLRGRKHFRARLIHFIHGYSCNIRCLFYGQGDLKYALMVFHLFSFIFLAFLAIFWNFHCFHARSSIVFYVYFEWRSSHN